MKLSCTLGGYGDLKYQIGFTKACGFDACDFPMGGVFGKNGRLGDIDNVTDQMIYDFFMPMREEADRVGLEFGQTHSVGGGRLKDEEWDDMVKREIAVIKATKILGAKYTAMHPIMYRERIYDKYVEENFEKAAQFFERLTPALEEYDVYGCLENMFAYDRVYKFYCPTIFSTAEEIVKMCDRLGDRFQICLDIGHSVLGGEDPVHMAHVCGSRVKILHTHDNDGLGDLHTFPFSRHRPHTGNPMRIDWTLVMRALNDIGYEGNLNFESGAPGPREINQAGYEYLAAIGRYLVSLKENDLG